MKENLLACLDQDVRAIVDTKEWGIKNRTKRSIVTEDLKHLLTLRMPTLPPECLLNVRSTFFGSCRQQSACWLRRRGRLLRASHLMLL